MAGAPASRSRRFLGWRSVAGWARRMGAGQGQTRRKFTNLHQSIRSRVQPRDFRARALETARPGRRDRYHLVRTTRMRTSGGFSIRATVLPAHSPTLRSPPAPCLRGESESTQSHSDEERMTAPGEPPIAKDGRRYGTSTRASSGCGEGCSDWVVAP